MTTVPCRTCSTPTTYHSTRLCNGCHEVESRLSVYLRSPVARAFVERTLLGDGERTLRILPARYLELCALVLLAAPEGSVERDAAHRLIEHAGRRLGLDPGNAVRAVLSRHGAVESVLPAWARDEAHLALVDDTERLSSSERDNREDGP